MIRNMKALGLALVAALALSAVVASAASAEIEGGEFTAGSYPAHVTGVDLHEVGVPNSLTAGGNPVECAEATYTGTLAEGSSTLQLTPTFHKCNVGANPVTITHNGCNYEFHVGTGTGGGDWHATASLTCPAGKAIDLKIYQATDPGHTGPVICTVTIGEQSGLTGLTLTDNTSTIIAKGAVKGVKGHRSGACTGGATVPFEGATLHVNAKIEGTEGNLVHIGTTE